MSGSKTNLATTEVGDYYFSDGSLESGETDLTSTQKKACREGSLDIDVIDKADEMLLANLPPLHKWWKIVCSAAQR